MFYVHYKVAVDPAKPPQVCTAGPYNEDEVLDQRRDISTYSGVIEAYVSENPKPNQ